MATRFSLKDPNPGAWFSFDDQDPKAGRICLRVLNQSTRDLIEKKCVKKRVEYKHGQRFEVRDLDSDSYTNELWDYCIVDWEKLEDDDGKPIKCTTENKIKLMSENVGFSMFVGGCIDRLNEEKEELRNKVIKNSSSTLSDYEPDHLVTDAEL